MFYIYEWFIKETGEVIYVGKGSMKRVHQKSRKNKLFSELVKRFECTYRIIEEIEDEEKAFELESYWIVERKKSNQCICNTNFSGNGGTKYGWTLKMRERMSVQNPMKDEIQKKRMSILNPMKDINQKERMSRLNPMKNIEVAKKVGEKHRKPVIINGIEYESVRKASQIFNVTESCISLWCKIGFNSKNHSCKYKDKSI